jgi:hypothetical protein
VTNPTYFTVTADYRSVVADLPTDFDYDPQVIPITANVTFTPVLRNGDVILATNATPRPTGFVPAPVAAQIDSDGRLKLRRHSSFSVKANVGAFPVTGDANTIYFSTATNTYYRWNGSQYVTTFEFAPVRLLADTDLLELATPLFYEVRFSNVKVNNAPASLNTVVFQAPTSDVELNLIEVGTTPGQPAVGITKIAPGAVRAQSGNLVFSFGGVDIPDPIPYANVNVTMVASDITDSTAIGQAVLKAPTADSAITTLTGTQVAGRYLRSNGTTAALAAIVAADVPTLNQNTTGSAATLTTGRTVQTSLSSTSAATFNGSANITPGVTGTLPVGNGGTGSASLVTSATASSVAARDASGNLTANAFTSTVATGTAPLTVASTTVVANLNAAQCGSLSPSYSASPTSLAGRDNNGNVTARGFINALTTTATAAGTTTLLVTSNAIQEFTGTTTQTVVLPTTGVIAGQQYRIINNSSGAVLVQSSALATVATVFGGVEGTFTALIATPTTAAHWEHSSINAVMLSGYPLAVAGGGINNVAARDGNSLIFAKGFVAGLTTTATAAGTTTLLVSSTSIQQFTGTSTQTCVLPTSSVAAGQVFTIINNSTGAVTVQSSALAAIGAALTTGMSAEFIALVATPTTAAHWHRR